MNLIIWYETVFLILCDKIFMYEAFLQSKSSFKSFRNAKSTHINMFLKHDINFKIITELKRKQYNIMPQTHAASSVHKLIENASN